MQLTTALFTFLPTHPMTHLQPCPRLRPTVALPPPRLRTLLATAALGAMELLAAAQARATDATDAAAPGAQPQTEVWVRSGRLAQAQWDAPASLQVIEDQQIRDAGPQVNLSEALAQVPGVVALNRNNYAQDVQISVRGFGARAAFGLRGIRLVADGIPATTPDGQGQASTVSLTSADRIEVLTGPLAQLYGNASGGVIQTFTREAQEGRHIEAATTWGSHGLQRHNLQFQGRTGAVGLVADLSVFETTGHRRHSSAQRQQLNAVLTTALHEGSQLKWVANVFDMPQALDPLGLKADEWAADPQQAGANAQARRTRKSVQQQQMGLVFAHRFDAHLQMQWRAYTGTRDNLQYLVTNSWVGLARDYRGVGAQLGGKAWALGPGVADWVVGVDADQSAERRQGGAATAGEKSGGLLRNEMNNAANTDAFGQLNWRAVDTNGASALTWTAGLRRSQVRLTSADDLPQLGGDGSGRTRHAATTPVLGVTWHAQDTLNVYANWGRGFETPTLAEAAYTAERDEVKALFNTALMAAHSTHAEAGLKWTPAPGQRVDAALFQIDTQGEIVTQLSAGNTAYKNAARTQRQGAELSWRRTWTSQWRSQLSAAWLHARYAQAFTSGTTPVEAGKRLPGIPAQQVFASLQWAQNGFGAGRLPPLGWSAAADWQLRAGFWANDTNSPEARVAGVGLLNVRLRHRSQWGAVRTELWAGVDNAANRQAVGSVIVNQQFNRFFEPALPRSAMLGFKLMAPL